MLKKNTKKDAKMKINKEIEKALIEKCKQTKTLTTKDIQIWLNTTFCVDISVDGVRHYLNKHRLEYNKIKYNPMGRSRLKSENYKGDAISKITVRSKQLQKEEKFMKGVCYATGTITIT